MVLVVHGQRPEAFDRGQGTPREGHGVLVGTIQSSAGRVEVLIEVLRLVLGVDEDI